jgi:uncharacterized protein (TIGR03437 family)
LTVYKATPSITWPSPGTIGHGTPLGAAQLDATANVPGSFVYTPAAGTTLDTGAHTLAVTFTPADTANYNNATATVTLNVGSAPQSISFAPIGDRWHGEGAVALNAAAGSGLPVTFAVLSGPATVSGQTLTLTGVGRVTVMARQEGSGAWQAAEATQSFLSGYRVRVEASGGITVTVDGQSFASSADFLCDAGTTHRIAVPAFQGGMPGSGYRFGGWSDSGAADHTVTIAADGTYRATFVQQFLLVLEPQAGGSLTAMPPSANGFYDAGATVTLEATPDSGHYFREYSGSVAGSDRIATVQMAAPRSVAAYFEAGVKLDAAVDAAGYRLGPLAPSGLYSLFGWGMGGCNIVVRDKDGVEKAVSLLYVSERQVNFMVPEGLAPGPAKLRVTNAAGQTQELTIEIAGVAPGVFTASQNGQGAPAGTWLRVAGDGVRTEGALASCGEAGCAPVEIDLGGPEDEVFLVLYGTGLRHGTTVTATIGGVPAPVLYSGAQGFFKGLDQVNLRVPRALAGRGEVNVVVTVDGVSANFVKVRIR